MVAILAFLNGFAVISTNLWFGLVMLGLGTLLSARYFSNSVREFTEKNRIWFMILTLILFGVFATRYYIRGDLEFALILGFFMVFVGVLLLIQIWAKRTFPDFE
jgi:uncharacterized membrane protein HdeD (DUF308 family)